MRVVAVEEHWCPPAISAALKRLTGDAYDPSIAFNEMNDNAQRLEDIGQLRLAMMDEQGVAMQYLSVPPPATQALSAAEAVPLSRAANDEAAAAAAAHPDRFRALATLPLSDPGAAVDELRRAVGTLGHVGVMTHGRTGNRPLDHPDYHDVIAAAAELRCPIFIHPQIPSAAVRAELYGGFDDLTSLGLASFGWGWHIEAGLAGLRMILAGTFDRHPDLQIVLGHWGELLLFWLDRVDSLSNVAKHLDRRVSDYVRDNVSFATSGMLSEHLLRQALAYTGIDRIVFSGDYPFHKNPAAEITGFLDLCARLAGEEAPQLVASANAERLFL